MSHAFISYLREDSIHVNRLADELASRGVEVWLDRTKLSPGQRWKSAIRRAIQSGDAFIACFSESYERRSKTFMNEELLIAIEELRKHPQDRAWFYPLVLSNCKVPDIEIGAGQVLSDLHWISLSEDWDIGVTRIAEALNPAPAIVRLAVSNLQTGTIELKKAALRILLVESHPASASVLVDALVEEDLRTEALRALLAQGEQGLERLIEFSQSGPVVTVKAVVRDLFHMKLLVERKLSETGSNGTWQGLENPEAAYEELYDRFDAAIGRFRSACPDLFVEVARSYIEELDRQVAELNLVLRELRANPNGNA